MSKLISLTQGKIAIVDDEDYPELSKYKWCAAKQGRNWYPATYINKKTITMHQFLVKTKKERDHRNGNGLDNRRQNLRSCTHQQNIHNQKIQQRPKSSQFKGVCWDNYRCKWLVLIRKNRKRKYIGHYLCELEAAMAYDAAAKECFGEFARINLW